MQLQKPYHGSIQLRCSRTFMYWCGCRTTLKRIWSPLHRTTIPVCVCHVLWSWWCWWGMHVRLQLDWKAPRLHCRSVCSAVTWEWCWGVCYHWKSVFCAIARSMLCCRLLCCGVSGCLTWPFCTKAVDGSDQLDEVLRYLAYLLFSALPSLLDNNQLCPLKFEEFKDWVEVTKCFLESDMLPVVFQEVLLRVGWWKRGKYGVCEAQLLRWFRWTKTECLWSVKSLFTRLPSLVSGCNRFHSVL